MEPRVDVVIRTRDRPLFLARALRSVAAQTLGSWHVVIVNDGGDPAVVREVVESAGMTDRVTHVDHVVSLGRWPSANAGVVAGTAEFIVLHDDDDSWRPEFLERTVSFLEDRPQAPGVVARIEIVWERRIGDRLVETGREAFEGHLGAPSLGAQLLSNRFVPIGFLYRRSLHTTIGPYRDDLPVVGDWEFYLRILRRWPLEFVPGPPLASWHQRPAARGAAGNSVIASHDQHRAADALVRDEALRHHVAEHGDGGLLHVTSFIDQRARDVERSVHRLEHEFVRLNRLETEVATTRHQLSRALELLEAAERRAPRAVVRRSVGGVLPAAAVRAIRRSLRTERLLVFPYLRSNPYLDLMYSDARQRGAVVLGIEHLRDLFAALEDRRRPAGVLHLQWTTPIVQYCSDARAARAARLRFEEAVDGHLRRGGSLVWTIHNGLPHECGWPEEERLLRTFLTARSDVVHVLTSASVDAVADVVALPADRTVVIGHPVPPALRADRAAARARRGLVDGERAVLVFGQIRADKGVDDLIEALGASDDPPTLLLVGEPRVDVQPLLARADALGLRVVSDLSFVTEDELSEWMAAADLLIAPYRAVLNSGVVHTAAAHDVPVVLPGEVHLVAHFGEEAWVRFFDPGDRVPSLAALLADESTWRRRPGASDDFVERGRPSVVSRDLTELLVGVRPRVLPRRSR